MPAAARSSNAGNAGDDASEIASEIASESASDTESSVSDMSDPEESFDSDASTESDASDASDASDSTPADPEAADDAGQPGPDPTQPGAPAAPGRRRPKKAAPAFVMPPDDPRGVIRSLFGSYFAAARARAAQQEHGLAPDPSLSDGRLAAELERACYNEAICRARAAAPPIRCDWGVPAFLDLYNSRCGTLATLLDGQSDASVHWKAQVAERLLAGELAPAAAGRMSERELCPAATEAERAEIEARQGARVVERESNLFRCHACGARRCTYQCVQTRSLDEPATIFCKCLECGARFRG